MLAALALGVPVLYLIAANLFLSLGGLAPLFASTNSINVTFGRAWTLWPGRIEARDLRVVFQDHNLQWSLDVARVSFTPVFAELAHRTFHARDVHGEGAVYRVRHRVDPWSKDEPSVRVLAPIPEFATPAVFEARVPEAPVTDAEYRLWTVEIEGVDVGVKEVWIQQFRYLGSGRARGAFRLRAARAVWVGPASLDLDPGRLTVGEYLLSPGLAGRIDCVVHPFDVRKPVGREVLGFISAGVNLRAPDFSLAVVELFFPHAALHERAETGALLIAARTDHGVLLPGSTLELRQEHWAARHPPFEVEAAHGTLIARALADGRGEARLEARDGRLALAGVRTAPVVVDAVRAVATSSSLDTARDWSLGTATLETLEAFAPDVRSLNGLLPHFSWRLASGALRLSAKGRYAAGELRGDAALDLRRVEAAAGAATLEVDGRARVACSKVKLADQSGVVSAQLLARRASLRRGNSVFDATSLHVDADARASRGDLRGQLTAKAVRSGARVPDAWGELLSVRASAVSLSSLVTRRGNGNLTVSLRTSAQTVEGSYGRESFRGAPAVSLRGDDLSPDGWRGRLGADLVVRGFSAADTGSDEACPWSSIAFGRLRGDVLLRGDERPHVRVSGALSGVRVAWGDFSTRAATASFVADVDGAATSPVGETLLAVQLHDAKLASGAGAPLGWDAAVPMLTVKARLTRDQATSSGPVELVASGATVRIGRTPFNADLAAVASLTRLDPEERRAVGSAALRISRLGMNVGSDQVRDWWADVAINSVDVSAKENLDLVGTFRTKMRDALPALTVLTSQGDLPGWVPDVFPLRQLEGSGTLERHCRSTELGLDYLKGGPFASSGRVQSVTDAVRGAFLVRFAAGNPLSAGVQFDGKDSGVSLFAGKNWLKDRYSKLDARQSHAAFCAPDPPSCGR